jgi:MinD-like ATPase involved in chromosome partitioning or flagellar assembly
MARTGSGQIITFYSYKGGTGRTMALANAGVLLARAGNRVLLMDWDLEAPGLHRYFAERTSFGEMLGTIDLLGELANLVSPKSEVLGDAQAQSAVPANGDEQALSEEQTLSLVRGVDLDRYLHTVDDSLQLIWAGASESDDYARRVSEFDWIALYDRAPYLFTCLAKVLSERFGYVFVDSRTGVSDTSGVCTAMLPEKLVVVFTPNRQSLDGALSRARSAVSYRRHSSDLRPLVVYPLASRVELSEDRLRRRWRQGEAESTGQDAGYQVRFERLFSEIYAMPGCDLQVWFDEVQIQQTSYYAYGEEVAAADQAATTDRLSLAYSYARFTEALEDTDGPWRLERTKGSVADGDVDRGEIAMQRLEGELSWHEPLSRLQRHRLLAFRALQVATVAAALVTAVLVSSQTSFTRAFQDILISVVLGTLAAAGEEALAVLSGATQWSLHAALVRRLEDEEYSFETGTRQYADADDRGKLLAERIEDTVDEVYRDWEKKYKRFESFEPSPRRPKRSRPS